MMSVQRFFLLCCLIGSMALTAEAFVPSTSISPSILLSTTSIGPSTSSSSLQAAPLDLFLETTSSSSSNLVAAATLDPTTFLSDLLGGFINSNLILAVPIVAALGLASLVAFLIVAYANPAEPNAEDE